MLAAVLAVVTALLGVAAPVAGAVGASVQGSVVVPEGASTTTVRVEALKRIPNCCGGWAGSDLIATVTPDASGGYRFTGLPAGSYQFRVTDTQKRLYVSGWDADVETDAPSPTVLVPSSGQVAAPTARLAVGAEITGTVSSDVVGRSLRQVVVDLQEPFCFFRGCYYSPRTSTTVQADGSYRFTGIPGRDVPPDGGAYSGYRITFRDAAGWFVSRPLGDESGVGVPVPAVDGETTDVGDQPLTLGGRISGRAVLPRGFDDSVYVTAHAWSEANTRWERVTGAYASPLDGEWTIDALPAGTYRLEFAASIDPDLPEEWYRDAATVEEAVDVVVEAGRMTTGIVADLRPPGSGPVPEPGPPDVWMVKAPRLTGQAKVGQYLTVTRGVWDPRDAIVTYRWFVRSQGRTTVLKKAVGPQVKLRKAHRGARLRVRLVVTAYGYDRHVFTSPWTRRVRGRARMVAAGVRQSEAHPPA